ncbi:MAG: hypothetical protein PW789_15030 [Edaphobacter sp.]|uniref:hypothetical protein n=1 Tax=Edaphobacter sp. TaxID=1934404 RepID=UPI00238DDD80|nr:hypothetical protein [Edaphobacter sp.]MDE1177891.1 hypothetical protein [Edaphobacter sp.]
MTAAVALWQQVTEHGFTLALVSHRLPFWFLVFALFLPRIALIVAWMQGVLVPFHLEGLVPLIVAIIVPRALILYLIYLDQGLSLWFVIHLVVALLVWVGGGGSYSRRRRRDD